MHIKTHQLDPNARPVKASRYGRVKVRDTRPNERTTNQPPGTSPMNQDLPSASEDLSRNQDLLTAAEYLPSSTGARTDEQNTSPNQDLTRDGEFAGADVSNMDADGLDERDVVDISSDDEDDPNVGEKRNHAGASKSRQLKAHEIKVVLDEWERLNQEATASNAPLPSKGELHRPKLQRNKINRWLANKDKYLAAAAQSVGVTLRRHQAKPRSSGIGHHPEMEQELAVFIKNLRCMGVPVEAWMIREEGKRIFREKNREKYSSESHIAIYGDEDVEYPIKFSNKWLQNFLDRHNFSFRKLTTKMNKKAVTTEMLTAIEEYHLTLRMKQLSVTNDPVYGFTSPAYVYSHDQVPLELAANSEKTIDCKGVSYFLIHYIYVAFKESDTFCHRLMRCMTPPPKMGLTNASQHLICLYQWRFGRMDWVLLISTWSFVQASSRRQQNGMTKKRLQSGTLELLCLSKKMPG